MGLGRFDRNCFLLKSSSEYVTPSFEVHVHSLGGTEVVSEHPCVCVCVGGGGGGGVGGCVGEAPHRYCMKHCNVDSPKYRIKKDNSLCSEATSLPMK